MQVSSHPITQVMGCWGVTRKTSVINQAKLLLSVLHLCGNATFFPLFWRFSLPASSLSTHYYSLEDYLGEGVSILLFSMLNAIPYDLETVCNLVVRFWSSTSVLVIWSMSSAIFWLHRSSPINIDQYFFLTMFCQVAQSVDWCEILRACHSTIIVAWWLPTNLFLGKLVQHFPLSFAFMKEIYALKVFCCEYIL